MWREEDRGDHPCFLPLDGPNCSLIFLKSHRNNKKLLEKSQFFLCWRLFRVKLNTFKPTHPSSLSHLSKLALPYIANFPPGTEARYFGVTLGPLSCSISDLVSLNLFNLKLQKRKYQPLLQAKCLFPSKIQMLKPNPQCDGIWRWDIWKMLKS